MRMILLVFLLSSCGAKKSSTSKTEEKVKEEVSITKDVEKKDESNVKKAETVTVDDKTETVTKETVYKPVDPTKSASVTTPDGKKIDLNNSELHTKETIQKNNKKTENLVDTAIKSASTVIEKIKLDAKSDSKKTAVLIEKDRKAWNVYNLFWLIIPIVIVLIIYRKRFVIIKWFTGLCWFFKKTRL